MRLVAVVCVIALVGSSGCSSSNGNGSTGPSGSVVQSCGGGNASGTMTATVSGKSFVATCLLTVTFVKGVFSLGGTDVSQNNATTFQDITFAVQATGPGTFSLAPDANGISLNDAAYSIGGSQLWNAGATFGGSGTVTLTTLTASSAAGTFSFSFVAGPNATGTKTLTNGTFNITF